MLDLRSEEDGNTEAAEGVECLEVHLEQDNDDSIIHSVHSGHEEE